MSEKNLEKVGKITAAVTVVIIASLSLKVAIVELGWAERTSLADRTAQVSDVAPASKSCGDFQLRGTWGSIPIKVEVVEGNIPCRVAQRVMRDEYRGVPTALWSCGGWRTGITTCEKNRHGTIRGRL